MIDELTSIGGWACFVVSDHYGDTEAATHQAGSPFPWVYFLPPDATALLLADHFWGEINLELGTLLDRAEEEELSPALSARMAEKILALAQARYRQGLIKREVAWRTDGSSISVEIEAGTLGGLLAGLATFLKEASSRSKVVIASL